nr:hypothetical protein [uncultured Brevundimonas sp.]
MSIPYPLPLAPFHRTTGYNLRPVHASEMLRAAAGFPLTPVNGLGDHWALEIEAPVMAALCGRALLANLVRGVSRKVRIPIPQRGIDIGLPGETEAVPHSDGSLFGDATGYAPVTPRVDGDNQSGSALSLKLIGARPGYPIRPGLFFTLETRLGSSAHIITEAATVDDAGRVEVAFWPMLWRDPSDGDHVEMFEPYIEGYVVAQSGQSSGVFKAVRSDAFTVEEAG